MQFCLGRKMKARFIKKKTTNYDCIKWQFHFTSSVNIFFSSLLFPKSCWSFPHINLETNTVCPFLLLGARLWEKRSSPLWWSTNKTLTLTEVTAFRLLFNEEMLKYAVYDTVKLSTPLSWLLFRWRKLLHSCSDTQTVLRRSICPSPDFFDFCLSHLNISDHPTNSNTR